VREDALREYFERMSLTGTIFVTVMEERGSMAPLGERSGKI